MYSTSISRTIGPLCAGPGASVSGRANQLSCRRCGRSGGVRTGQRGLRSGRGRRGVTGRRRCMAGGAALAWPEERSDRTWPGHGGVGGISAGAYSWKRPCCRRDRWLAGWRRRVWRSRSVVGRRGVSRGRGGAGVTRTWVRSGLAKGPRLARREGRSKKTIRKPDRKLMFLISLGKYFNSRLSS